MCKPDLSAFSAETVALVMGYSYMSNRFMSFAFRDRDVQEHIIRTGLNDPDIDLAITSTQFRFNNILGREITFDSVSEDTNGDVYNVEVENRVERGGLERATYHISALDTQTVHKGLKDFRKLPKANGIMFVLGDSLHNGKQKTVFEIRDVESPEDKVESSRLKYVIINVHKCDGEDALSQLCRDLQQSDYRKISNEHLARRMQEIKEGPEAEEMCREEEEFGKRKYEKGRIEGLVEGAENQVKMTVLNCLKLNYPLKMIAGIVSRSIEEVESYAIASGIQYRIN